MHNEVKIENRLNHEETMGKFDEAVKKGEQNLELQRIVVTQHADDNAASHTTNYLKLGMVEMGVTELNQKFEQIIDLLTPGGDLNKRSEKKKKHVSQSETAEESYQSSCIRQLNFGPSAEVGDSASLDEVSPTRNDNIDNIDVDAILFGDQDSPSYGEHGLKFRQEVKTAVKASAEAADQRYTMETERLRGSRVA